MIELIKLKLHHSPEIKGLVTMHDPLADFSQKMVLKIRNMFKEDMFATIIYYDIALKEAQEKFISIFEHNKDSKAARDYNNLADEILISTNGDVPEKVYDDLQKILYDNVYAKEKTFEYEAPKAENVYVVGDFNDWKINEEAKLEKGKDDKWQKRFFLPPGRYKYKYVVDGLYFEDPRNPEKERNPYGNNDSIFHID
jgi:1,4-alpha-glucan branching enzyme